MPTLTDLTLLQFLTFSTTLDLTSMMEKVDSDPTIPTTAKLMSMMMMTTMEASFTVPTLIPTPTATLMK